MSEVQEEAQDIPNLQLDATFNGQDNEVPPLEDLTGGFQAPSIEQILAMVETMEGLSDEDRDDLKRQLLQGQGGQVPLEESGGMTSEALILLTALSLIIFIFVFFGYKLYKSLKEKERKRDEKRRLKQQKKKK